MQDQRQHEIKELLERLGGLSTNRRLLDQALTHSSYANEENVPHNERLEFLGDAVLELLTSQYLYRQHPGLSEGELTRMRANLVCEPTLAAIAQDLGLGSLLKLGKSQLATGGRERPSLLADAVEALLGAVYISGGLPAAQAMFDQLFTDPISALERGELWQDYKTRLQEMLHKMSPNDIMSYQVVAEKGPDHNKTFFVEAICSGMLVGKGQGKSKKEAEQAAAKEALDTILKQPDCP